MARRRLSQLSDWELVYPEQDARGHPLRDQAGNVLGTVVDMIVDTDGEYIDAIVLENGSEYSADDFELRRGGPVLRGVVAGGNPTVPAGYQAGTSPPTEHVPADQGETVQLREEQFHVEKETVQTGEVVLRKEIVTEPAAIDVPVRHEEIFIEHRPVEPRPATRPIGQNPTIAVRLHEEAVRLEKQPVVVEQITVTPHTVEDIAQVSGTLLREDAVIQLEGNVEPMDTRQEPRQSV